MAKPKKDDQAKPEIFIHPNTLHIFTDGSMRPPECASFAYLIFSERTQHVVAMERHACRGSTINQMELMAINKALDHPGDYVVIYSDSAYSISCLTIWNKSWERNNWIGPTGEPIKNKALIQEILAKMRRKKFCRFMKIKAHTGDHFNSVVDYLAQDLTIKMRDDPKLPNGPYPC